MTTLPSSASQDEKPTRLVAALVVFFLGAIIYLGNAGFPGLLDDADASHAMVSWEMLHRHDPVILYMNGIRYLMKAPLHYWAVAMSYGIFGRTEFATRLPVALAMIGLALLVNSFARRYFGVRAGLYSALAVLTGAGFFLFTRIMIPEGIYALEFTAIFYLFLRGWTGSLEPRLAYWGAAAVTALAMLTRGLVGVIFPAAILGLFVLITRGWRRLKELHLVSSTLIFLIVAAPWHVLASLQAKTFFWSYFINEHFKRAVGTRYPPDYEAVPLWLWLGAHLIWLFPWSIFLVSAFRGMGKPSSWKDLSAELQARLLLILWGGFILLFFSLTFGSRMEYYSFGGWPALAMLLGIGLAKAEEEGKRWLSKIQGALALVGFVLATVLITLLAKSAHVQVTGDISSLLEQHENDFYRVSMAHMLDLTPQAFALLRLPAALAAIAFLIGFGLAWLLRRSQKPLAATLTTAATMGLFFFAANIALGVFGPYLSSKPLVDKVKPQIRPTDTVAIYGEFDASSSVAFYTGRELLIWNGRYNNLEAGSYYPDAPPIFLTDDQFLPLWNGPERIFLFVPSEKRPDVEKKSFHGDVCVVAESGGKVVFSNQPAPNQQVPCSHAKGT
ncbi:MAG TPA: glycosyltransferase family 39 protein [Candidatus Acidoferrum sp.]|nr:glycosyltransferase family 39 protein [Candidatus Acidoferrum sp.]